ncbi:hypothetical protein [Cohnella cholangitidis]|uniref:hypothetical protein n=1 Tax=Cohnella cholangitidis TaxID=2598458 RepID=UPI0015F90EF7|nr:hypothetical protein [Cohnella cholangitidis]
MCVLIVGFCDYSEPIAHLRTLIVGFCDYGGGVVHLRTLTMARVNGLSAVMAE